MTKYLIFLNWLLAAVAVLVWFFLVPHFGIGMFVGSIVGGMTTAGLISWQYHKDGNPDKDTHWRVGYFGKDYGVEWLVQGLFAVLFLALALFFLQSFSSFFGGLFLMWWFNISIESCWYWIVIRRK